MNRRVRLLASREWSAAFDSAIAPVTLIVSVLFVNTAFMNSFFLQGRAALTPLFTGLPLFLAVLVPALTMRLFAEERKTRTIELLFSLPITTRDAVLGKFLASCALLGVFLAGTLPIPILVGALGAPAWGEVVAGYLGIALLGAELAALGLLASALARDQIVAFVGAAVAGAALILLGDPRVKSVLDGLVDDPFWAPGTWLERLFSPTPHVDALLRGDVAVGSVLHFVLFGAFFLWAASTALHNERR